MKKLSVFEFKDYKVFLVQWMARAPNEGRGQRKLLAEAVGCQTPFITHVLTGDYHFSLEQAEACAWWMGLTDSDTEFLLLLVIKQRAGTKNLESFIGKKISELRVTQENLKQRLQISDVMRIEDQLAYYSNWHFAAIHIACMVPKLQTVEALQKHFGLSLNQAISTLEFLTEHGFIQQTKSGYRVLKSAMHLESHSPLLPQHHSIWRLHAIEASIVEKTRICFIPASPRFQKRITNGCAKCSRNFSSRQLSEYECQPRKQSSD